MTLSACIMAGNEVATIERCLASVRPYVDELCFLDTGSTDGTLGIAKRYADVIDHADWEGFGATRNLSLSMATSEYILVVDADEWIKDDAQWADLRTFLYQWDPSPAAVRMRLVNLLPDGITHAYDRERVFRNDPALKFAGLVQAQCTMPAGNIMTYEAAIHHDGYDRPPDELKERYLRRIPLYHEELAGTLTPGKRAYYLYHLALCQYMAGELFPAWYMLGQVVMKDLTNIYCLDTLHLQVRLMLSMIRAGMHEDKLERIGCNPDDARFAAMNLAKYGQAEPLMLFHAASLLTLYGYYGAALSLYRKAEELAVEPASGRRYEMPVDPVRSARREVERRAYRQRSREFRTLTQPN